jgi:hypothetical protein
MVTPVPEDESELAPRDLPNTDFKACLSVMKTLFAKPIR